MARTFAQLGQLFEKLDALAWPRASKSASVADRTAVLAGLVAKRPADLLGQLVVQPVDQIAHVVGDVAQVQPVAAAIAGIEDLLQVFGSVDDRVVVRQRAMAQVVDRADLGVGLDDPLGQLGQVFFEAKVGGHTGKSSLVAHFSFSRRTRRPRRCPPKHTGKQTKQNRRDATRERLSGPSRPDSYTCSNNASGLDCS